MVRGDGGTSASVSPQPPAGRTAPPCAPRDLNIHEPREIPSSLKVFLWFCIVGYLYNKTIELYEYRLWRENLIYEYYKYANTCKVIVLVTLLNALKSSVSDFDSNGCYVLLALVTLGCHVNLYKPLSYEEMTTSILWYFLSQLYIDAIARSAHIAAMFSIKWNHLNLFEENLQHTTPSTF